MYKRATPIPGYRDPDTAEAENLIIASRLLQDVGRSREAKALADQARALFEDAPYDGKRRARVLGAASCSPEGTLRCRPKSMDGLYEVASYPYDDRGEAEAAAEAAAEARFLKLASGCVRDLDLGWLAAAQLSSALSGKPVRPVRKSLAKAATALYGAASVASKAGWSGPAAKVFRDLIRKSRILDEPLGTEPMREDAKLLSRSHMVTADEGSPDENGGWILWFPPGALPALAKSLDNCKTARFPRDEVEQAIRRAVPLMRGAWYPGPRDWDHHAIAKRISIPAVAAASEATGISMEDLDEAALDVAANVETALCRAMRAKRIADACRVFREAATRDADTETLFLRTGFVPPKNVAVPEDHGWYGDVAAAVLETGWRGHGAYAVRGERSTDGPRTTAFRAAAFETSRTEIKKWFASDEAAELFAASPGAYRNCPAPDRQADG